MSFKDIVKFQVELKSKQDIQKKNVKDIKEFANDTQEVLKVAMEEFGTVLNLNQIRECTYVNVTKTPGEKPDAWNYDGMEGGMELSRLDGLLRPIIKSSYDFLLYTLPPPQAVCYTQKSKSCTENDRSKSCIVLPCGSPLNSVESGIFRICLLSFSVFRI